MDVFIPPRAPSPSGSSGQTKARLVSTNFGDGYIQDMPDGVNPFIRSWTFAWDPLTPSEMAQIVAFLEAHVGQPFYFTLPGEVAPRTVIEVGHTPDYPSATTRGLTVQFQERFVY